jgi:small subunit ribosomal protein S10
MTAVKKTDEKKKTSPKTKDESTQKKSSPKKSSGDQKKEGKKQKDSAQQSLPLSSKSEVPAAPKLKGIRIRLSAFDHMVLDETALKIIDTAVRTGAIVHGPIPLPTKIKKFTVNRSTFVHKDARDQFEMRIHRRLIDLTETTFKTVDSLQNLSLPSGVDIEIRMG